MGAAVGIHKTVHTEVAVVGILAVVTAVPVHGLAVFCLALVDGVITPFPDKAAAHDFVGLNELPVVFQVAGAVAHGVGVLTHQVGLVGIAVYVLLQGFQRRIHIGVQVDVGEIVLALSAAVLCAFVVSQTGGIEVLGPGQGRFEAATVSTFVTHGPADDAGAVLIPDDTPLGAVQGCFQEVGIVGKGLVPVLHVVLPQLIFRAVHLSGTVAFVVGFVDDHETVLVTQLIEHGSVGIVSSADGVEVEFLDHLQVPLHVLQGDHRTSDGVGVVAVDAPELNGVAVQVHLIIFNVNLTEAPAVNDDLIGTLQNQGVQVRLFGIPELGFADVQHCLVGEGAACFHCLGCALGDQLTLCVIQLDGNGDDLLGELEADPQGCFITFQVVGNEVVPDVGFRAIQDVHIPEDAGGPELILVFQVAAVAPFQNQNCQGVLTVHNLIGDIELGSGVGNLVVAQVLAVEPCVQAGVYTFKVQVSARCVLIPLVLELGDVAAAGVFVGYVRGICGEGIADVGVVVLVVTVVLPDAGYRDGVVVLSPEAQFVEQIGQVVDIGVVLEFPISVEKLEPVGAFPMLYQIIPFGGCGDVVGTL